MYCCAPKSGAWFQFCTISKNVSRCLVCSETCQQIKVPYSAKTKKKSGNGKSYFDWENELLYGPLVKHNVTENVAGDVIGQQCKRGIENDTSQGPSLEGSTGIYDHLLQQQTAQACSVLTIPHGFMPSFPLQIAKKDDDSLHEAAKTVIDNYPDATSSPNSASVTSILQSTMSPESAALLDRWRKQMIAKLGTEGFAKYQEDTFQTGSSLHKSIQHFLQGQPIPESEMDSRIRGHWKSIFSVLTEISDVVRLEDKVAHPYLCYHGIADCIAKHRNKLVLIEWKTSQKPKPRLRNTYDNPLQVAAYMGAYNAASAEHVQLDSGVIVVCYPDGTPAHAHIMEPQFSKKAWESWLIRLRQYWQFRKQTDQGTTTTTTS